MKIVSNVFEWPSADVYFEFLDVFKQGSKPYKEKADNF